MAPPVPPEITSVARSPRMSLGFLKNARKHKDSFIQWIAMTGIFMLSMRSLGQKYRIHEIEEETAALKDEEKTLTDRMNNIKRSLFHEASLDPTGNLASRLRQIFGSDS